VLIQARSVARLGESVTETTVAEAGTDAGGRFTVLAPSLPPAAGSGTWLRALYPGAAVPGGPGATISPPLALAPALTPPAATAPSPPEAAPGAP
jgi:hypothetical protein